MPVKHKFVSTRQDGLDPTKVKPSDWNDDHEVIINLGTGEVIGILPLELGGTGASDAYNARINLGLGHLATLDLLNLEADAYGMLPMNLGGTGAGDASNARSNLGLGYLAILNQINLTSDAYGTLPLNLGGTGGYDAYSARSNLGLGYLAVLNQINLSTDAYGTLPLNLGGTGGYDQASAINNLLPYQGYYSGYFLHTDGSNVSWQHFNGINEVPYDGNIYARQNGNWTTFSQVSPGGNYGDVQFNYYGSFYGDGRLHYDFGNYTLYHNGDWYSYMPRQISRASYYQYADLEQWQDYYGNTLSAISHNGGFKPAFMYNWDADNNSIFYDYNNYRLAFKDQYGSVRNFVEEAPYDGNSYARQNDGWVIAGGGVSPGGNGGDVQFNYYGTFYGESYLNYDFNNHILYNTTPDFYSYYPRQINRAGYYQYADLEQWQDYYGNTMSSISHNGGFKPAFMYSSDAENNSLFFDYSSNKLAFKDQYGNVYNFY